MEASARPPPPRPTKKEDPTMIINTATQHHNTTMSSSLTTAQVVSFSQLQGAIQDEQEATRLCGDVDEQINEKDSKKTDLENSREEGQRQKRRSSTFLSLGDRIESTVTEFSVGTHNNKKTISSRRRLRIVGLSLCISLVVVFGLTYVALERGVVQNNPDWNHEKHYDEFDDPYDDIIIDTIPFIQDWYRGLDLNDGDKSLVPRFKERNGEELEMGGSGGTGEGGTERSNCIEELVMDLEMAFPFTSPKSIERVLDAMGLSDEPRVRSHLGDLLLVPQPLAQLYSDVIRCNSLSLEVFRLACTVKENMSGNFTNTAILTSYVGDAVNTAVVWDVLTTALLKDLSTLSYVAEVMVTKQRRAFADFLKTSHYSESEKEFRVAKYTGVAQSLKIVADALASNGQLPYSVRAQLQVNILEAVKLDVVQGYHKNARVGLSLATLVKTEPFVEDHRITWGLGQDWVKEYTSWNAVFVSGSIRLKFITKLFIPSLSCTYISNYGEDYLLMRTVSLALSLMTMDLPLFTELEDGDLQVVDFYLRESTSDALKERSSWVTKLEDVNYNNFGMVAPSKDSVEEMLYTLCAERCHDATWKFTNTNPISNMDEDEFKVYFTFVLWVTVLLAGFGSEVLVWLFLLENGWKDKSEAYWKYAQFAFPLLAVTTFGLAAYQNYMALLTLVLALWKFGFPETFLYMYHAIYSTDGVHDTTTLTARRVADILNAVGVVGHHGAASLLICAMLTSIVTTDRHIMEPILILIMQHWFVLLHDVNLSIYVVVELFLEVWFEWTTLSNLEHLTVNHWMASLAAGAMLVGHWLYCIAGGLELYSGISSKKHQRN